MYIHLTSFTSMKYKETPEKLKIFFISYPFVLFSEEINKNSNFISDMISLEFSKCITIPVQYYNEEKSWEYQKNVNEMSKYSMLNVLSSYKV